MRTIKVTFKSEGETIKKTAVINNSLDTLSTGKVNQAYDICEYPEDGFWSVVFEGEQGIIYEVEFKLNRRTMQRTLTPIKAITWKDDVISDVQRVKISTK